MSRNSPLHRPHRRENLIFTAASTTVTCSDSRSGRRTAGSPPHDRMTARRTLSGSEAALAWRRAITNTVLSSTTDGRHRPVRGATVDLLFDLSRAACALLHQAYMYSPIAPRGVSSVEDPVHGKPDELKACRGSLPSNAEVRSSPRARGTARETAEGSGSSRRDAVRGDDSRAGVCRAE